MQLEARFARTRSLIFFFGGLGLLAVNALSLVVLSIQFPVAWPAAAISMAAGLRGFDRRIKLRCGPEGLFYAPWGPQPIPWSEFDGFSIFHSGDSPFLELYPKYPDQLRARMSAVSRVNASVNARFGKPPFYINPNQLDVGFEELLAAVGSHMSHAT